MAEKMRLVIVEDHAIFRAGLRRALEIEEDIEVVSEAVDGAEAIDLAETLIPDVMLMDINLPGINGLQATRIIKAQHPEINIVVLTAYHDDEQLLHALRAGASAYHPKEVSADELLATIRQVYAGNYVLGDQVLDKGEIAAWLMHQFEEMSISGTLPEDVEMFQPLTDREMEILRFIAQGLSNKEIARTLHISQQTVKNHITSILRKLAVNDRTQAAVYALKRGWIRLQDMP